MKLSLPHLDHRLKKIKRAFQNREDSQQISARIAKLITDTGTGKLSPSEVLAKSVALYLRRQHHLYGDEAYVHILDEIMAFLSETSELESLIGSNVLSKSQSQGQSIDLSDKNIITDIYKDSGIYGLIQLIEKVESGASRRRKAARLLEFGKILKTTLLEQGLRSQLAKLALQIDKSEPTYRGACWSLLNDGNAEEAVELFIYLYLYYQENSDLEKSYFETLHERMLEEFSQEYIDNLIDKNKQVYLDQRKQNILNTFEGKFSFSDKNKQISLFTDMLKQFNGKQVIEFIDNKEKLDNKSKAVLALRAATAARALQSSDYDSYITITEQLADYALECDKSEGTLRNVYFAYQRIHAYEKSSKILALLKFMIGDNPNQKQRNLLWSTPDQLLKIIEQIPERRSEPAYKPILGKVCYVLHNSLPYSSGGYATRGHGLLVALKNQGLDIYALTRPGYPHDITKIQPADIDIENEIDGVVYKRLLSPSRRDFSNYEYMLKSAQVYKEAFLKDRPEIIIVASNHINGLPVMFAARELGIKFIYEIRGFWEITKISKLPKFELDPMFKVEKQLEAKVAQYADHIFTLTQGMVNELEAREVTTNNRISLLPNSCNIERFNPKPKDLALLNELQIPQDIPVIGYVGTLVSYEGLDDLALACGRLKELGFKFRLLIVGNENASGQNKGSLVAQIQEIAKKADYLDWLIMPGRVPFEEVERYYSLIDIAPFPRKAWPVCEIVPPMKTLEALSMKKAVLVSSNTALTEMITHDVNGRVFERGNVEDLTIQLQYILSHPEKWQQYGEAGREFVKNERTWEQTAKKAMQVLLQFLQ